MNNRWIKVSEKKPDFGQNVFVYCKIFGRFVASYERINEFNDGNWRYKKELGILPPIYWMEIEYPEYPKEL